MTTVSDSLDTSVRDMLNRRRCQRRSRGRSFPACACWIYRVWVAHSWCEIPFRHICTNNNPGTQMAVGNLQGEELDKCCEEWVKIIAEHGNVCKGVAVQGVGRKWIWPVWCHPPEVLGWNWIFSSMHWLTFVVSPLNTFLCLSTSPVLHEDDHI